MTDVDKATPVSHAVQITDDICEIGDRLTEAVEMAKRLSTAFQPPEHHWNELWMEVHILLKIATKIRSEATTQFLDAAAAVLAEGIPKE